MPTINGRNCKVEVALTFATAVAPTAVTKAYPPVATLSAHGLTAGAAGYWSVAAGMVEMHEQAVLIHNPLTNTFDLPGLDSTDYSTYTAGSLVMAASWGVLAESAGYAVGGGAADQLDDTRLLDVKKRNVNGLLAAQDVTIDIRNQEISGSAMAYVERQALRGLSCLFKVSRAGQVLRVFYGVPSLPGEAVQAGGLASGQFVVNCPAFAIKPNV
jgi:hypothetical protein